MMLEKHENGGAQIGQFSPTMALKWPKQGVKMLLIKIREITFMKLLLNYNIII